MAPYCPLIASPKTYTGGITVTGNATYQYRNDGNGPIVSTTNTWKPTPATSYPTTYSLNVNGAIGSYTCTNSANCKLLNIVAGLVTNLNSALNYTNLKAHGTTAVDIYPSSGIDGSVVVTASSTGAGILTAQAPRPIRYAEVQITTDKGDFVQCVETDSLGNFSAQIPGDGAHYNVSVMARSLNSHNSAYILNNPNDNVPYKISTSVQSSAGTSVTLVAPAVGTLEGGAFNIMDQVENAQEYLRSVTTNCDSASSSNYFAGCTPVTTVPIVYSYWTPGLSPNVYYGSNSPISYYLIGKSQLYIGGGSAGDSISSDMDQFDNSVIIHEYGHFIEDHFAAPNSPGGSHSGRLVIDPRLAWGEGWANFFQAAVTGIPIYRDTYGSVTCGTSSCANGIGFLEPLEDGEPTAIANYKTDIPTTSGEGNFHEFSISRALWAIIQPSVSQFSEVWTTLNGVSGMRVVNDPFKTVGRFHVIHTNSAAGSNKKSWSTQQSNELQLPDFSGYATPVNTSASCTSSSIPMTVIRSSTDDGSFQLSNQFQNNDFFVYNHGGGTLPVSFTWGGGGSVDLDLFIYGAGYVYGSSSSILAYDMRDANGSTSGSAIAATGSASVAPNLPAGLYIINVMAATGAMSTGSVSTTYSLSIGNHAACPSSL